ncbi:PREDICTED: uncharacterized protein LOC105459075 [Wasmannia auropunctata]|uniref:uncharacterized protein LOC105459075 n=1 Tax=Wasmannia auropunctata TaxID=64793 RepID=UPI0005EFCB2E|nr:PREDICTED: uncharacterized protein LOC105459075 [Wasmannia auropunctata]XP_011703079.1 PREDICTED: uncharacterized protein LOC105459075 [Wasmannia auropunctata]
MDLSSSPRYVIRSTEEDKQKNPALSTRYERIAEQSRIIKNWKPQSDVWPLRYGRGILIGAATLSGLYINARFRAKLKLRNYGTFVTMLGLTVSPATAAGLLHTQFILNKLILLEVPCPLCLESRSALAQTCSGVFLPMVLAPLANFSIAAGSGVYNVPYVTDVRGILRTVWSAYQPMIPKIAMIFTFHALLASFVTYLQIRSFLRMLDAQYLIEEEQAQKLKN